MAALRAFLAELRAALGTMLQYRGEILLWSIWGIIHPAVLYAMWSAAAASGGGGDIAGLDRAGLAAYFFVMMIVGHVSGSWDVYTMGYLVRHGSLSPMLLRPVLPMWHSLAENVSYKIATLAFVIPAWTIFALIIKPRFEAAPWQLALGTLAVLLGAALNYILCYTVSLVAFWAAKLDAMGEVYFGLAMFLGGRFAPVEALPSGVWHAAMVMPFRWMFQFPTDLLMGRIARLDEAARGIGVQAVLLAAFIVLFRLCWRAAVKRYTAVSG